jgi:hypothetical protein
MAKSKGWVKQVEDTFRAVIAPKPKQKKKKN